jgi:probable HAF family extracellular repeat protein
MTFVSAAAGAPLYHVTDLGDLPGGARTAGAYGLNDVGQVVGSSDSRAFLWTPTNGMQDLGVLPGRSLSTASSINNAGQVVGRSEGGPGERAFLWTATGGMQDLGDLPDGALTRFANDINNAGQVVGGTSAGQSSRAFLWTSTGGAEDLGPGGALGINDAGQVVGAGDNGAFLWTRSGGQQDLSPLPGHIGSQAWKINNVGQIVGESYGPGQHRAVLWTPTNGMQDLGVLPGDDESWATDINDAGQVVGLSLDLTGPDYRSRAFLWTSSEGMQDLSTLLDPPSAGWSLINDSGVGPHINNAGQIAITGVTSIGENGYALLLTPIPEPATLAMGSCGIVLVAGLGLRRGRQRRDKTRCDRNDIRFVGRHE